MQFLKVFGLRFTLAMMYLAVPLLHGCALLQRPAGRSAATSTPPSSGIALEPLGEEALLASPSPSAMLPVKEKSELRAKWRQTGEASWYGPKFHGKTTASGDTFDQEALTAAHASLPFGSKVKVTNLSNGKSVELEITDRGPFAKNRIIDVTRAVARVLGMKTAGTATVRIEPLAGE